MSDYDVNCPHCGKETGVDNKELPDRACDNNEVECHHCEKEFWYAEVEVRTWRKVNE